MAQIGDQILALADDYARALDDLAAASTANIVQAMEQSLDSILGDLGRFYNSFTDETIPSDLNYQGQERRPNEYSIAQATARFSELVRIADGFLPPAVVAALEARYRSDLRQAAWLGGELGDKLLKLVDPGRTTPFSGPSPVVVQAAADTTSAYIRGEAARFRNDLTQIVLDGINRGVGYRALLAQIRQLLDGAADPFGITLRLGAAQRAELIARSELANAYVAAQLDYARREGYSYVRWIATTDERTCWVCASRHGRVYKLGEVVAPAHPRCRCVLSPVANEVVEDSTGRERKELLEVDFWAKERVTLARELSDGGGSLEKALARMDKALAKPTPSEKRRYPDITTSAKPVA